ncbi:outer envelope pore protein 24B, chloroplastic-like isoform X3 [Dendrobium catenatum]|uniref:outer envelope pore protein 24B, chloroplastic-like isoform X3 n=1 Tax=Dendrobium catenatum TaxID=906689 RepID=UPI00109F7095|nr:outer envelope pore protein 24B, chloroplastic-like isoform X3 [Dendrobium catenatum]
MKAKVKGRYEAHRGAASAALSITSDDLKLTGILTDATFSNAPALTGLALSIQKPGSFSIVFDVPKKDINFQFMNEVALMGQAVRLTYTRTHALDGNGRMALVGSTNINIANKVGLGYEFCTGVIKVRYAYTHGDLEKKIVVEPCLDLSKNAWEFAVTRWFEGRGSLMAVYHAGSKDLGIEWRKKSKVNGSFKVTDATRHSMQRRSMISRGALPVPEESIAHWDQL